MSAVRVEEAAIAVERLAEHTAGEESSAVGDEKSEHCYHESTLARLAPGPPASVLRSSTHVAATCQEDFANGIAREEYAQYDVSVALFDLLGRRRRNPEPDTKQHYSTVASIHCFPKPTAPRQLKVISRALSRPSSATPFPQRSAPVLPPFHSGALPTPFPQRALPTPFPHS